jgi:hypothetical protein
VPITILKILYEHIVYFGNFGSPRAKVASMSSRVRKSRRPLTDEEHRSSLQKKTIEERLDEMQENVSLDDVPLEERRKEAQKPLFLTRYE